MYEMQVKVRSESAWTCGFGIKYEWKSVCPTGGPPYRYTTELEAWQMLEKLYPNLTYDDVRVIKVT